jgi:aminopeptidase N
VPADGLIISKNKYGDRTFFSDHWPNRARHWLPCHDTPADKATVAFYVVAPEHYRVVANGLYDSAYTRAASDTNTARGTVHYWKEATPIPTKVMAVGVARFAVQRVDSAYKVPVTAWVYPRDSAKGVFDYSVADDILRFFDNYVGSFAFSKLANVQSKTIFGGMENAGAIFYAENTVTGNRSSEGLVAHEVAHQWFGNMATEKSFAHLWLSEGFATYMTNVYWEAAHGREAFVKKMQEEREEVVRFARRWNKPVVDTASDLMNLLNANSYQKGGWVLHMLRQEAGDEVFRNIVRTYYDTYKGRNADTRDFQQVAEQVSGKNLDTFFRQWLYTPGHPRLQASWRLEGNSLRLTILQQQDSTFRFPLTVGFKNGNTLARRLTIDIVESTQIISVDMKAMGFRPTDIVLDPDTQLLFEGKVSGRAE